MRNKERQPADSAQKTPRQYGIELNKAGLERAYALVQKILKKGPFEFDVVAKDTQDPQNPHKRYLMVVPPWCRNALVPLLRENHVPFRSRRIASASELSPQEQAKHRGLGAWHSAPQK